MTAVADSLERFRRRPSPPEGSTSNPFKLVSTLEEPVPGQLQDAWHGYKLPDSAVDLWAVCGGARLFEDVDYGQWGLRLLSPAASASRTSRERNERPSDIKPNDIVLGEFIGDSELLVLAPSEVERDHIFIALPLDDRADWFRAAPDLSSFLTLYFNANGDKYWEHKDAGLDDEA